MSNQKETFSYKGYFGSAEVSQEDECFAGQILYIDDLIMYEGDTYKEFEQAFQASVDNYLAFCEEEGKEPQKTYSGSFNIRIGAVLHGQAVRTAALLDISLNEFVRNSIAEGVANGTARSSSGPLIYFGTPHFVSGSREFVCAAVECGARGEAKSQAGNGRDRGIRRRAAGGLWC